MPKVSVTLVLFAVLCLLALHIWQKRRETALVTPFLVVAVLLAVQALFTTLRWDFGFTQFHLPKVLLASVMPGISWLAFEQAMSGARILVRKNLVHTLPLGLTVLALIFFPGAIDIVITGAFLIYGMLFFRLMLASDVSFSRTAVEAVFNMRRAVGLLAFTMLGSALIDVIVYLDFLWGQGQHAAFLIGIGNLLLLVALAGSIALGSSSLSDTTDSEEPQRLPTVQPEDHQIAASIRRLLVEGELAKDPNLTLSRLARRAGLPARAVSNAINRVHRLNVSQFVNDIRIAEACRLLRETEMSVTQTIYASGFQTKSNFNREFLRVTGKTPKDWRKKA